MCGADIVVSVESCPLLGSSPRVRSRQRTDESKSLEGRIISACAEQTSTLSRPRRTRWDHLRVCGADTVFALTQMPSAGSSPRVRSRPEYWESEQKQHRIISACAEQTTRATFA